MDSLLSNITFEEAAYSANCQLSGWIEQMNWNSLLIINNTHRAPIGGPPSLSIYTQLETGRSKMFWRHIRKHVYPKEEATLLKTNYIVYVINKDSGRELPIKVDIENSGDLRRFKYGQELLNQTRILLTEKQILFNKIDSKKKSIQIKGSSFNKNNIETTNMLTIKMHKLLTYKQKLKILKEQLTESYKAFKIISNPIIEWNRLNVLPDSILKGKLKGSPYLSKLIENNKLSNINPNDLYNHLCQGQKYILNYLKDLNSQLMLLCRHDGLFNASLVDHKLQRLKQLKSLKEEITTLENSVSSLKKDLYNHLIKRGGGGSDAGDGYLVEEEKGDKGKNNCSFKLTLKKIKNQLINNYSNNKLEMQLMIVKPCRALNSNYDERVKQWVELCRLFESELKEGSNVELISFDVGLIDQLSASLINHIDQFKSFDIKFVNQTQYSIANFKSINKHCHSDQQRELDDCLEEVINNRLGLSSHQSINISCLIKNKLSQLELLKVINEKLQQELLLNFNNINETETVVDQAPSNTDLLFKISTNIQLIDKYLKQILTKNNSFGHQTRKCELLVDYLSELDNCIVEGTPLSLWVNRLKASYKNINYINNIIDQFTINVVN